MRAAPVCSLLLVSVFLMTSAAGGERRKAEPERAEQRFSPALEVAAARLTRQACTNPHEVLLAGAGCGSTESIFFSFYATGGAVLGLHREFTPGTSNFIHVAVEDCPAVLQEIRDLAEQRGCAEAPSYGESISMVCDGGRDSMIDIVARMLRIAYADAPDF